MSDKMSEMKFIKTTSYEVAEKLRVLGFTELTGVNSSVFCFMNDGKKITFDVDASDYVYTNILCI